MAEQPSSPVDSPDPGNVGAECYCQLDEVMGLLSRQYAMQVVCAVGAAGPVRYGDIEEAFGDVSSSTLSNRLEELVDAGYPDRQQYTEIPPRVEYDLTYRRGTLRATPAAACVGTTPGRGPHTTDRLNIPPGEAVPCASTQSGVSTRHRR